jgi:hypothetical protein
VPGAEGDAALVLAAALNFQLLPISTAQQRVLAAELAPVSLSENGHSAVPAVRRALFAEIEKAAEEQEKSSSELDAPPAAGQASMTPWDQIKIGQLVLSQEENPKDGWWEAIVLNELNEGEFLLRYRDYSPQYRFVRRGEQLALLKPA